MAANIQDRLRSAEDCWQADGLATEAANYIDALEAKLAKCEMAGERNTRQVTQNEQQRGESTGYTLTCPTDDAEVREWLDILRKSLRDIVTGEPLDDEGRPDLYVYQIARVFDLLQSLAAERDALRAVGHLSAMIAGKEWAFYNPATHIPVPRGFLNDCTASTDGAVRNKARELWSSLTAAEEKNDD